ncbi:hypothetical protein J6590_080379 [Homalodisca vitripennis]|nr:hypothetical protein J6590_080379 [Homalodisca vitripennis]
MLSCRLRPSHADLSTRLFFSINFENPYHYSPPMRGNPLTKLDTIFDFQLSKLEMLRLGVLDRGEYGRRFILEGMFSHPEYPYSRKTQ